MKITTSDTCISLEEGTGCFTLFEKPEHPDYTNVTERPHTTFYYVEDESVWDRFRLCMERLPDFCPDDPYLGCYALILRRLYSLLLSTSQAKNVIAYGAQNCGAYPVIQDFMTFLHKGNALTALALSPFSLTAVQESGCCSLLYRLDTCPAKAAVCNAIGKVKPGGLVLLYTIKDTLPTELGELCARAEKDSFGPCTVYALPMDGSLSDYARANGTDAFVRSRANEVTARANDLRNLLQAMLAGAALPGDAYVIAATILQQIEEILLSIYDHLSDDELPVRANALKEAVLNYYVGISRHCELTSYREKLRLASENLFAAVNEEFSK